MPTDKWVPIGPTAVRRGQALGNPTVAGRVNGIAFGQDGAHIYAATANGGVWFTQDGGLTWKSLMEGFDLNPTTQDSDSLACGALAVVPGGGTGGADRIYVGSGEPYGQGNLNSPVSSYYGVGMLMSDDGGLHWTTEPATPSLVGAGAFRLAVDPGDKDRVVAAVVPGTSSMFNAVTAAAATPIAGGVYMRVPAAGGGFTWERQNWPFPGGGGTSPADGSGTSVAVARSGGLTVFYAVIPLNGCCKWDSTTTAWQHMDTGLPSTDVDVIALAMQPGNTDVVYALISDDQNYLKGVWRLDTSVDNTWRRITGAPATLFGDRSDADPSPQGDYDVAIAVAPDDPNVIYLGGSGVVVDDQWVAALYRCKVDAGKHTMTYTHIGRRVHADVHALEFPPGDTDHLWVGCDGGVFVTDQAGTTTGDRFVSRNTGVSTVQTVRLGLHPTEPGVVFAGSQDNGTLRYIGEEVWLRVGDGDGGAVLVNPHDTARILRSYKGKQLQWTTEGAQDLDQFIKHNVSVLLASKESMRFYPPMVSPPFDPATSNVKDADIVALGSQRVWLSRDFGKSWKSIPKNTYADDALDIREIEALAFASPTKLYAGTSLGNVFQLTYDGTTWHKTSLPIPNISGASNPGANAITSIAVDPADASGDAIYVSIGGTRDPKATWQGSDRVWHYTPAPPAGHQSWEARSGPTPPDPDWSLLDVHHSVVIVDPDHPQTLYAGANIGVWRSSDSGGHWFPYSFGLPDAAVTDLRLHHKGRVLFAATDGRGVYAMPADSPVGAPQESVMLLVRDTPLDARYTQQYDLTQQQSFETGLDPTSATACTVTFGTSPDIRVDTPDSHGNYLAPTTDLGPVQFAGALPVANIATGYAPKGSTVVNRVYVQVHNHGSLPIGDVQVMLLFAPCPGTAPALPHGTPPPCVAPGPPIPALPAGYADNVRAGTPISGGGWETLGVKTLQDVRPLMPRIAQFDLPSDKLTGATEYCLLVLLHNALAGGNLFPDAQGATTAWGAQATDVRFVCSHTPLAAYKRLHTTATTRTSTHPDPSLFAQILTTIGLGFLVASDGTATDNTLVNT